MPVYDRMYTHERRPIVVGRVEVREMCAVGICAAGSDKNGSHSRVRRQVEFEGVAEGYYRFGYRYRVAARAVYAVVRVRLDSRVWFRDGRVGVGALFLGWARVGGYMRQIEMIESSSVLDEVGHGGEWVGWFGVDGGDRGGKGERW